MCEYPGKYLRKTFFFEQFFQFPLPHISAKEMYLVAYNHLSSDYNHHLNPWKRRSLAYEEE